MIFKIEVGESISKNLESKSESGVDLRKSEVDYIKPIYGDEAFFITSFVKELKSFTALVSCTMKDKEDETLSTCQMHLVCLDKKTQKPVRWPEGLFETYFF